MSHEKLSARIRIQMFCADVPDSNIRFPDPLIVSEQHNVSLGDNTTISLIRYCTLVGGYLAGTK